MTLAESGCCSTTAHWQVLSTRFTSPPIFMEISPSIRARVLACFLSELLQVQSVQSIHYGWLPPQAHWGWLAACWVLLLHFHDTDSIVLSYQLSLLVIPQTIAPPMQACSAALFPAAEISVTNKHPVAIYLSHCESTINNIYRNLLIISSVNLS